MRILVYPHTMEVGGSQLNALQLAGAIRDRGHEVIVLSERGALLERVHNLGIEHIEIPLRRSRPSPWVIAKLLRLVHERSIDLVHGYEWPPVIEALFGPGMMFRTPVVGTVMSMSVASFFPHSVPLSVGTELIRRAAIGAGHQSVNLMEPPVDTEADNPSIDGRTFRAIHGVQSDEILIAMICRLVPELKLEGLLAACDAVGELSGEGFPVRLVIVGEGRARSQIAARAQEVNAAFGRTTIFLTGEIADPRPAYAAADVIVGQGGSALRGMAFGKPLIVVGEEGFSELLTPESAPLFLSQGWYGLGAGSLGSGSPALRLALARLVGSPTSRRELGVFARRLVVERFSLQRAAALQEDIYLTAMKERVAARLVIADVARSAGGMLISKIERGYRRRFGFNAVDDANARSVVADVLAGAPRAQSGK